MAATILPGLGVLSGEASLSLGDSLAEMKDALGEPARLRALGAVGTMFDYPQRGFSGLLDEDGKVVAIYLSAESAGKTDDGAGIDSTADELESQLGKGEQDPFLSGVWYDDKGLVFEFAVGIVTRVHLLDTGGEK